MHFWHQATNKAVGLSVYICLEPKGCIAGGGIWRPDGIALKKIRDGIAADGKKWTRAIAARRFQADVSLVGEFLKRPPAGYDPNHPCVEDIKRRDFAASASLPDEQVTSADFINTLLDAYHTISPYAIFVGNSEAPLLK